MPKRIGEILIARGYATPEQIRSALEVQAQARPHRLLGQILLEQGVLSQEQTRSLASGQDSLLLDVIGRINSTLDTDVLLTTIMKAAEEMMGAEASSLMLLDRQTGDLDVAVPTGPVGDRIRGARIPRGKGFCGWVVESGRPLVVNEAEKDDRFFGDLDQRFHTCNLICVPLRNQNGDTVGVLEAINKRDGSEFTASDVPLFAALADHVAIALERARLHEEEIERQRLAQQLTWAKQIQQGFLRREMPRYEGIGLAALNLPAIYVSGDYYDVIPIDARRCALVIADVSGKGAPAALLMATIRAVLQSQAARKLSADETVRLTNEIMTRDMPPHSFVTLFYGLLDTGRGDLTYVNAGHNPPMLYDPATRAIDMLDIGGTIIGFDGAYPYRSRSHAIRPGHLLVLYTDGVTEATNRGEEFFGQERLEALVREHGDADAPTVLARIREGIERFTQGAPQHDDITLLVMKAG